jgi:hypothetical protein
VIFALLEISGDRLVPGRGQIARLDLQDSWSKKGGPVYLWRRRGKTKNLPYLREKSQEDTKDQPFRGEECRDDTENLSYHVKGENIPRISFTWVRRERKT